jgi:hypothetical protein
MTCFRHLAPARTCGKTLIRAIVAPSCTALLALGCGGDESTISSSDGRSVNASAPLFAVTTQVFGDVPSSYVALVSDLGAREEADLGAALEVPGRALAVGPQGGGYVLVATSEGPSLTRYDVLADGTFVERAALSFANEGVSSLLAFAQQFVFVSRTKAYFLDDTDVAQIVVFNPEEMTIERTIPIEGVAREGFAFTYGLSAKQRGNELVLTASFYDDESSVFDAEARLVIVDTVTDSVKSVETETRCGYLLSSVESPSGDIYFAADIYTSIVEESLGDEFGGPSCVLRLPAGQSSFDPEFILDLEQATGGTIAGSLVAGNAGRAYTRYLDRSVVPEGADFSDPAAASSLPYYRWAEVDLDGGTATPLLSLEPGAAQSVEYSVESRSFIGISTADFASTTLLDFASDPPREGMTFAGVPFSIVRVR